MLAVALAVLVETADAKGARCHGGGGVWWSERIRLETSDRELERLGLPRGLAGAALVTVSRRNLYGVLEPTFVVTTRRDGAAPVRVQDSGRPDAVFMGALRKPSWRKDWTVALVELGVTVTVTDLSGTPRACSAYIDGDGRMRRVGGE